MSEICEELYQNNNIDDTTNHIIASNDDQRIISTEPCNILNIRYLYNYSI